MADTAVTKSQGRDRAHARVAVTTRPVHAGTTKRSGKTPSIAAPPLLFGKRGHKTLIAASSPGDSA